MSLNHQSSSSARDIIFRLFDHDTAEPYDGTSTEALSLSIDSNVDQFKDAVGAKYGDSVLKGIDSPLLTVYKNKTSFDKRENKEEKALPLKAACLISGLGESEEEALIVVVPSMTEMAYWKSRVSFQRKERWKKLNEALTSPDVTSRSDWTSSEALTWDLARCIFSPAIHIFPQRSIDYHHLDLLAKYLSCTSKHLRFGDRGWKAEGLHMTAAVLICVANIFDDVEIDVEKDLEGNFLKTVCHLDFMIRRANKAICVVKANMGCMQEAFVQVLVGCEIAAEVGHFDYVYGIFTDCEQWFFVVSHDDKIGYDILSSCAFAKDTVNLEGLTTIAETICAMLSNE